MYLRMLKKDLKDKVGLNIVLCIFMIIAATLLVMSAGFMYTLAAGIDTTYEKCNSSDVIFTVAKSISDEEGQRKVIDELLRTDLLIGDIDISERVLVNTSRFEFEGVDRRSVSNLYENRVLISPVSHSQNIPYDINDSLLSLSDGCVAIPQAMAANAGSKPGDSLRLTTDLGNIYEFTISNIYKDPSSGAIHKILFSDNDHAKLMDEFWGLTDLYEIKLTKPFKNVAELRNWGWDLNLKLQNLGAEGKIQGQVDNITTAKTNTMTNEAMVALIIGVFMILMGVSLIVLIFMCIRFSLRATIKREEREIGTMKAIGVDSLSYRSLFIVKYIAFAVVGGIIGIFAGTFICRYMIRNFISNTLNPQPGELLILGAVTTVIFIALMVLFSYMALRRMKKISVMDTIHGENRGERFKKLPGVFLHKSRRMSVPFFLASCDISGRIKRYLYLIISYTMGIVVLLLVSQIKSTIVSDDFRRSYWQMADRELLIRPMDELRDRIIDREGSYRNAFLYYERFYNENGIPLNIQIVDEQEAFLISPDNKDGIILNFGDYEIDRMKINKGGRTPQLPNEVAVSHILKELRGINLGDTISLEYKVYGSDGFNQETVCRDFIVTAYVETANNYEVFMTRNGEDIVAEDWWVFNEGLDVPDSEYHDYIEKMRALNEDIMIWDFDQVLDYDMGNQFGTMLDMLMLTTGSIIAITVFAMTFLYQQTFMEEEASDIAMLKSLGVDRGSIRRWQYERILLLVVIAAVAATVMSFTVSRLVFGKIGEAAMGVAEFYIAPPGIGALLGLSLGMVCIITVVLFVSFKTMDRIKIWRVRNE